MGWFEETFGDDPEAYREYGESKGDFDLFPAGTRVLCKVAEAIGKTNKNGKRYPAMKLTVTGWPSDINGNFGSPILFDHLKLTLPDPPNKYFGQTDDVVEKKKAAAGIWLRQTRALGLDPETLASDELLTVEAFFAGAVGHEVLVKVGVEAASKNEATGKEYRAKNTVEAYEPATQKALERWKIKVTGPTPVAAEAVPF